MYHALFCIDVCTQYSPQIAHYEFDVLALWFFIVELVGEKFFLIEPATEEKVTLLLNNLTYEQSDIGFPKVTYNTLYRSKREVGNF